MSELTQTRHYTYDPIISRKPVKFPGGKRIAVAVYMNVEHFPETLPGTALVQATTGLSPDALNAGWRDYGNRVGIWRIMGILDALGIKASVCLNSDVAREFPQIVEQAVSREWELMGHGVTNCNSDFLAGKSADEQRASITKVLNDIEAASGIRPKGWLSPFLSQTFETPDILAQLGVEYLCDYTCDDQPFDFITAAGRLVSVPYSLEINDIPTALGAGYSADQFGDAIIDQFDMLYEEGVTNPRVMPICLHGFVTGQAFRAKHLRRALQHIAGHSDVWFATGGEINRWYREQSQ